MNAQGEAASLGWIETAVLAGAATFAGVTYDPNRSYMDRDGAVWFFSDTISEEDGTWHLTSSADCYKNSLADVVLYWGPLRPYGQGEL
ncbi:phiSA1p31-related protein [Streptomyces sp. NPDC047737]|uniref:phiSA1p31-related protein n=1 Tax=Streptomyces sp. NPDC047737 TaxID=3155740 RepID=UPI0033C55829